MNVKHAISLFGSILLAGCVSAPGGDIAVSGEAESRTVGSPDAPERLVSALVAAAQAEDSADRAGLLAALDTIDGLNGRPATEGDRADLDRWRSRQDPATAPMRGRILGPGYRSGRIAPGARVAIEQTFLGGQSASIALSTRERKSLEFRVSDARDKTVCSKVSINATCRWLPVFTQHHRIELVNPGASEVVYYIAFE